MKGKNKMGAILLAMLMFASALIVMASVPVGADVNSTEVKLFPGPIYGPYYLGTTGNILDVRLEDIDSPADSITEGWVNLTENIAILDFTDTHGNEDGDNNDGVADPYDTNSVDHNLTTRETAGPGTDKNYFRFGFNVEESGAVGDYTVQLDIQFVDAGGSPRHLSGTDATITIRVASRATVSVNEWFAGDDFKELKVDTTPVASIQDVYMNITRPDSDFEWQSATVSATTGMCWLPGAMTVATPMLYRMGVDPNKAPGHYDFTYTFEYTVTATGVRCYETDNEFELLVDFTPIVEADATNPVTIAQGDASVDFPITFTNNGNVDLMKVEVKVDPITLFGGKFYEGAQDHWEGTTPTVWDEWVPIGDLDIGESADAELFAALDLLIPPGPHKILLDWQGYYNDEGQTRKATAVVEVKGDWDDTTSPNYKERTVPGMSIAQFEENTHTGAFVVINVTDDELSFTAELVTGAGTLAGDGDVTNQKIKIRLTNNEKMKYVDVFAELEVSGDTPFLNPTDHTATTVEMIPITTPDIDGDGGTLEIEFYVDLNAAWWQTDSKAPGVFDVDVIVDATNNVTKDRIEDTPIPVVFEVTGFGAQLYITMVSSDKDINPGSEFVLSITITNEGDDVARNIDATLTATGISGWEIVDKFVTSIASYQTEGNTGTGDASDGWSDKWAQVQRFNRTIDIHPKDLAFDDITDIVEGYAYIERTFTPPKPIILSIHTERLEPGESIVLAFEMTSDVNMIEGMLYKETLTLKYNRSAIAGGKTDTKEITIRTHDKGDKYSPTEEVDYSWMVYTLIFVIIAIFCFILGGIIMGKKPEPTPAYEEPYTPYEPEPEPEPAPPMPEEETPPEPPPE